VENQNQDIKLIECPRDAMQGLKEFINTKDKIRYINQLLKVGYDTIDFGSFVSPKAIPQMRDTSEVLKGLDVSHTNTKLSAIVANIRGATEACKYEQIDYLGYPFSISETFQMRNTNATIEESFSRILEIHKLAKDHDKEILLYISMAFGNPYGDLWNGEICKFWIDRLAEVGINLFALSDTIGVASSQSVSYLFDHLVESYPELEFGAHFHTRPNEWQEKIEAAYENGCRRFDSALRGYGGCPMAKDDLTGNMPTENLYAYFTKIGAKTGIKSDEFHKSMAMAEEIFPPV